MTKQTIYLSGLPRAGTTLLANILANNPKIGGGETSPLLEYIFAARSNYSTTPEVKSALSEDLMRNSFIEFCKGGIEGYSKEITNKPIYLDKSRGWLHYATFLWEIDPQAKIIVCVRDIRGIVSSLEKKWRENPEVVDNRDNQAQQNFITPEQRAERFLSDPPLGIALKRLYNAHQTGILNDPRIILVRFEDLSENPDKVMKNIYSKLNLEYFEMDYTKVKQVTVENDRIADFGIYGDHTIRPNVKPLKKDWNEILGKQLSDWVRVNHPWFYEKFNYM